MSGIVQNPLTHPVQPEEVMALHDGELEPADAARVQAHLRECADCAGLSIEFGLISERCAAWAVASPGERATDALHAEMRKPTKQRPVAIRPWMVQWTAAAAILFIVFAISMPNLWRSRITANETSSVGTLRTLVTVCEQYAATYGGYPASLRHLGPGASPSKESADLIDAVLASGRRVGYVFHYLPGPLNPDGTARRYSISAVPVSRESGRNYFYTDNSGVIRMNANGPATARSQPIDGSQSGAVAGDTLGLRVDMPPLTGPIIVRSASLAITAKEFEVARSRMEEVLRSFKGYVADLAVENGAGGARSLRATLRVPSSSLDAAFAALKSIGRVESETLTGEEVTKEHSDMVSRHANARATEKRLTQVLENRTGKVADVLAVEREIARVRAEIEQLDAQRKGLENRVSFATIQLRMDEEYKAQVNPAQPAALLLVHNAAVEGYRSMVGTALSLLIFLLSSGPTLLLWGALLFWPARSAWRRLRPAHDGPSAA